MTTEGAAFWWILSCTSLSNKKNLRNRQIVTRDPQYNKYRLIDTVHAWCAVHVRHPPKHAPTRSGITHFLFYVLYKYFIFKKRYLRDILPMRMIVYARKEIRLIVTFRVHAVV